MNVLRSPTRSGLATNFSGSQPNLSSGNIQSEFSEFQNVNLRSKRKKREDDESTKQDIGEIRKQISMMMSMLTTFGEKQQQFMEKISSEISSITEQINSILSQHWKT
ncbi:unnamed protein product, partial [Brenthis ino]